MILGLIWKGIWIVLEEILGWFWMGFWHCFGRGLAFLMRYWHSFGRDFGIEYEGNLHCFGRGFGIVLEGIFELEGNLDCLKIF